VHLADGTRALTTAGRWLDAETHLQQHNGIGTRMLDGRQVAVIARATSGRPAAALRMLADTAPGEPWEAAVTACLAVLCQPAGQPAGSGHLAAMINAYGQLDSDPTLIVFTTRLALSIIDSVGGAGEPALRATAHHAADAVRAASDGYAARDLLGHPTVATTLNAQQVNDLTSTLDQSGLCQPLPDFSAHRLDTALRLIEKVIAQGRHFSGRSWQG
jgi:hypothetical protein